MVAKLCFVLVLVALVICHTSVAAPQATKQELLEKSLADYLKHDKELIHDLEELGFGADRVKRQSEVDTNDTEFLDAEKQPGFFDRAAKFVLELMQRFLRWINTDDS